jgi:hypothetical protein
MEDNNTIDCAELIDTMICAAMDAGLPPSPSIIATALSDVLFREAPAHYPLSVWWNVRNTAFAPLGQMI